MEAWAGWRTGASSTSSSIGARSSATAMPSPAPAFPPVARNSVLPSAPGATSPLPTIPQVPARPTVAAKDSTPKPTVPPHRQLKNPQVMEAVMAARVLRESQDMLGAIEALKSADLREPNHPEVLGEMALTYEAMLNKPRAEALWRQIYAMGESEAGGYFTLAASKIGSSSGSGGPSAPPRPVSLGPCLLQRDPIPNQGERISLRLPILATQDPAGQPERLSSDPAKVTPSSQVDQSEQSLRRHRRSQPALFAASRGTFAPAP